MEKLSRRGFLKALAVVGCTLAIDTVPELTSYPEFSYAREWSITKQAWLHNVSNVRVTYDTVQFHVFEYADSEIPSDDLFRDMLNILKDRLNENV